MLYINHEKKAIFIHIPKTAGSYISKILVSHYGFINYLSILMSKRPDHDIICNTNTYPIIQTGNSKYDNSFFNKSIGLLTYCQTSDYINEQCNMNEEKWNTYFKFCFVRNPYSKMVSAWNHISNILPNTLQFEEYIRQNKYMVSNIEYGHAFMTQSEHIMNPQGNCGVDMIGKFERLEEDLKKILNRIGFTKINHIPKKINSSNSSNVISQIDTKSIKIMNYLFADDFNNFRYYMIL
jgi:hypothetical protein